MKHNILYIFLLSFFLSGCFSSYPTHIEFAEAQTNEGKCASAGSEINQALQDPLGKESVSNLFERIPEAQKCYEFYLNNLISDITGIYTADAAKTPIERARKNNLISDFFYNNLLSKMQITIIERLKDGRIKFTLNDNPFEPFPYLLDPKYRTIIVNNTIKAIQENNSANLRPVKALMEYAKGLENQSDEKIKIQNSIPSLNLNALETKLVTLVFPEYKPNKEAIEIINNTLIDTTDKFGQWTVQYKADFLDGEKRSHASVRNDVAIFGLMCTKEKISASLAVRGKPFTAPGSKSVVNIKIDDGNLITVDAEASSYNIVQFDLKDEQFQQVKIGKELKFRILPLIPGHNMKEGLFQLTGSEDAIEAAVNFCDYKF
ncbi:hypothetical protein [Thiomicrorhabdus aquaedulcis]|uniref:hypothetical protein n=1 Tax=Thiomicrorhabdus aquaedulcis TaxID=2211106 RepID=UPI000FDAB190|nr:hypothetical protein [Thiomicrorhabdus aquaedulcis]